MDVNLNKQRFLNSEIYSVLDEFSFISPNILAVGGCVRDFLIGMEYDDIDIASATEPQDVIELAENRGFNVYETGVDHGTVTLQSMRSGKLIEHTTFRKDVSTDGRRATVEFADNFKEDSKRRDFTICAMGMRRNGTIMDFHQGVQHLKEDLLDFVGDTQQRLDEDKLRTLRAFRFACRFGLEIQPDDMYLIAKTLEEDFSEVVSIERVFMEIEKAIKQFGHDLNKWYRFITYLSFRAIPYIFDIDLDGYSIRRKVSHPSVIDNMNYDSFIHNLFYDQDIDGLPLTVAQKRRIKFTKDLQNGSLGETVWKYRNVMLDTDIFQEDWFIQFLGFDLDDVVNTLEDVLDEDWPDELEGKEIGEWQRNQFLDRVSIIG